MAEFTSYAPGTPCWVDVTSSDLAGSRAFYEALFGWDASIGGPEMGGYTMFTLGGKNVAGGTMTMSAEQPSAWTTYVAVEDANDATDRARKAGGTVLVEPMDVLDVGRLAVFTDNGGAAIAVWQPRAHLGADLANEPGTFTWNELQTRDTAGAKEFYRDVFGWDEQTDVSETMTYTEWKLGDKGIGGMMAMPAEVPAQVPAHWLVYFAVDNCDAAVAKANELGGTTIVPSMDIEPGRFAVLADPTGATFAVITPSAA